MLRDFISQLLLLIPMIILAAIFGYEPILISLGVSILYGIYKSD